jgi:hypothetical protein
MHVLAEDDNSKKRLAGADVRRTAKEEKCQVLPAMPLRMRTVI